MLWPQSVDGEPIEPASLRFDVVSCHRERPWPGHEAFPSRPWPDCSVRRVTNVALPLVTVALADLYTTLVATPAGHRGSDAVVRGDPGWLTFTIVGAVTTYGEHRLPAALHVHRCGPSVPVELVLAPWSPTRSELRIQLRSRRRLSIPHRFFDVAHPVMDALRAALESRVEDLFPCRPARSGDPARRLRVISGR